MNIFQSREDIDFFHHSYFANFGLTSIVGLSSRELDSNLSVPICSHSQSSNHSSLEYPNLFTCMNTGYTQSSNHISLEYLLLDLQLGTLLQ